MTKPRFAKKSYVIMLRTKEYRISTDIVDHKDGSCSHLVFCNSQLVTSPNLCRLPKTIEKAIWQELALT